MTGLRERIAQACGDPGSFVKRKPEESLSRWSQRAVLGVLGDPDTLALIADALHQSDCAIVSLHPQPCTERGTLTDHRRAAAVVAALTKEQT